MLALAGRVGKQTAHDLVYQTAMAAAEAGRPLKDAVLENAAIAAHLTAGEVDALFDYRRQIGLCPQFVDRIVAATESLRREDVAFLDSGAR